jgi:uncharacterized protein with ParB-like and HNH nuclease domain
MPKEVMVVIDGQQRLTTMLLLVISLDNAIRKKNIFPHSIDIVLFP